MSNSPQTNPHTALVAVVEDDAALRDELSFQLQHHGFQVVAFADAYGLYRHMATNKVAAVVLDIGLPGEDGLSIARLLRGHDAQLGIVFLTARAQREDRLTGLQTGADAYLTKPVDLDELVLLLRRLLARLQGCAKTALRLQPRPVAMPGRKGQKRPSGSCTPTGRCCCRQRAM
jgi:DNA-binding response OmpR family regulator